MSDTHAALDKAITDHAASHGDDPVIVTKWVLVAEIATVADEDRNLMTVVSSNTPTWDVSGMAGFAEARCKARYANAELDEDD